jgi:hypothetical protein
MAAVEKSDLVKGDPIDEIRRELDAANTSLEKFDSSLKSVAKTFKSDINPAIDKSVKGIKAINENEDKNY